MVGGSLFHSEEGQKSQTLPSQATRQMVMVGGFTIVEEQKSQALPSQATRQMVMVGGFTIVEEQKSQTLPSQATRQMVMVGGFTIVEEQKSLTLLSRAIRADSRGGGIGNSSSSVTFLSTSIVSGNTSGELGNEVYNGFFFTPYYSSDGQIDDDNNLFGDNSQSDTEAFFNFTPGENDINATSDGINIALDNILDPSLADNGGSTLTHALVTGSPAIDAGTNPLGINHWTNVDLIENLTVI